MPTDHWAIFETAWDVYWNECHENLEAFETAFRERIMNDSATRDLFLAYACDRLIGREIASKCKRRAKAIHDDETIAARGQPSSWTFPEKKISREAVVKALQKHDEQRRRQRQQQQAMGKMVDESVQRHQQRSEDFAAGDHVLLVPGPGSMEIPGTVVSITPEQVIVHLELTDGSVTEYPLSPQALQKQRPTSDQRLTSGQHHDDRDNTKPGEGDTAETGQTEPTPGI
jgi:hypothetical protein